jgi:hypothetical protein
MKGALVCFSIAWFVQFFMLFAFDLVFDIFMNRIRFLSVMKGYRREALSDMDACSEQGLSGYLMLEGFLRRRLRRYTPFEARLYSGMEMEKPECSLLLCPVP